MFIIDKIIKNSPQFNVLERIIIVIDVNLYGKVYLE